MNYTPCQLISTLQKNFLNKNLIIKSEYQNIRFFAKRNKDMRMKVSKFEKKFNVLLPNLDNEIKKISLEYKN